MPEFTTDDFDKNIPAWEALFDAQKWPRNRRYRVVEIGSFEGRSTTWIARNLLTPGSTLHCIDPWGSEAVFERFKANIAELPNADAVQVIRQRSDKALMTLGAQGLVAEFVYIDGCHFAPDVLTDLVLAFQILRPGGLIICDDYLWEDAAFDHGDIRWRPKIAVDAFTTVFGARIKVPGRFPIRQVVIQKRLDAPG